MTNVNDVENNRFTIYSFSQVILLPFDVWFKALILTKAT